MLGTLRPRGHPRGSAARVLRIGDPGAGPTGTPGTITSPHVGGAGGGGLPLEPDRVSVLLVEDDAIVRAWVRLALDGSEFRLAGEASTAGEAARLAPRRRPDLLLVDFNLPDRSGLELIRRLRARGDMTPAVVMTATARSGLNEAAREAGAQGSVVKSGQGDALLAALRSVRAGEGPFDPRHPRRAAGREPLTPREREVLRLVARGGTNAQVAEELGVGAETVKTLLGRIYVKLGVRRRAEAVSVAERAGIL